MIGEDLMARNLARARFIGVGSYEIIAKCYGVDPIQQNFEVSTVVYSRTS